MAQENDPGVAYLLALKQSSQAAPGDSAGAAPGSEQQSWAGTEQYEGANKRRTPRYKCEGSVEIREEGCDVRTWATFTDISLYGCYVEAQAMYPVGTILNMKLDANGMRVETRGNVRVNYPYLGMGIAFVAMSDENEMRLRQMLATISRGFAVTAPGMPSTLPATSPLISVPPITDPAAAIQQLIEFFDHRQMMKREDFLRIMRKSQVKDAG
jgi:hypothetical protein